MRVSTAGRYTAYSLAVRDKKNLRENATDFKMRITVLLCVTVRLLVISCLRFGGAVRLLLQDTILGLPQRWSQQACPEHQQLIANQHAVINKQKFSST
jgi:hypothetical protein